MRSNVEEATSDEPRPPILCAYVIQRSVVVLEYMLKPIFSCYSLLTRYKYIVNINLHATRYACRSIPDKSDYVALHKSDRPMSAGRGLKKKKGHTLINDPFPQSPTKNRRPQSASCGRKKIEKEEKRRYDKARWNVETMLDESRQGFAQVRKHPGVNVRVAEEKAREYREHWKPVDRRFFCTTQNEFGF